jgi:phosphatidate cytidylyltransferase
MNNLTVRILFAVAAIPLFLFLVYYNEYTRWGLVGILGVGGAWEFSNIYMKRAKDALLPLVSAWGALAFLWAWWQAPQLLATVAVFLVLIQIVLHFQRLELEKIMPALVWNLSASLYGGLWLGMAASLYKTEAQGWAAAMPFLFTAMQMWVADSGAYFAGKSLGKHKMAPRISPKKTWEGLAGGSLLNVAFVAYWGPGVYNITIAQAVIMGVVLSVTAVLGDLVMSTAKRYTDAKDFSQIFPGHGGILDRFDSFYLSAPVAVVLLQLFGA